MADVKAKWASVPSGQHEAIITIAPPGLHGPDGRLVPDQRTSYRSPLSHEDPVSDSASLNLETSRRSFLRKGAAAAIALPALASTLSACGETKAADAPVARPDTTAAPKAVPLSARQKADAMDAMHEKGIKAFPAKTDGQGQPAPRPAPRARA